MSKKDDPNYYEFPFRTNYELRIAAIWIVAAAGLVLTPLVIDVPMQVYFYGAIASLVVAVILGRHGVELAIRKSRLKGYKIESIDITDSHTLRLFGLTDKEVIRNVTRSKKR